MFILLHLRMSTHSKKVQGSSPGPELAVGPGCPPLRRDGQNAENKFHNIVP